MMEGLGFTWGVGGSSFSGLGECPETPPHMCANMCTEKIRSNHGVLIVRNCAMSLRAAERMQKTACAIPPICQSEKTSKECIYDLGNLQVADDF